MVLEIGRRAHDRHADVGPDPHRDHVLRDLLAKAHASVVTARREVQQRVIYVNLDLDVGMVRRGYSAEMAERVFKQIEGFGSYGFPESHAASFAHLAHASSWMKCHHPAVFACALQNSQPMGFYALAQIVRDAREHGVMGRPISVNASDWDCTLEPDTASADQHAIRLGLRLVVGLQEDMSRALVKARTSNNGAPSTSMEELALRTGLSRAALDALADADAFGDMGWDRREATWDALAVDLRLSRDLPLLRTALQADYPDVNPLIRDAEASLSPMPEGGGRWQGLCQGRPDVTSASVGAAAAATRPIAV